VKLVYTAFDRAGSPAPGSIEARDISEAREQLRRQGLFVVTLREAGEQTAAKHAVRVSSFGQGRKLKNVAMFTRQLHVLISTGTPLVEALAALERQTTDMQWRSVLAALRSRVEEGVSLSAAMAAQPDQFNAICRGLVAAGESGGNLDVMLDRLAILTRKQVHVRTAIMGAMVYPCLLVVVALVVLVTLLTFVLPRFTMLFKSLDTALPPTTQLLMYLSDFLIGYWWAIIIVGGGCGFAFWTWIKTSAGKRSISTTILHTPKLGAMTRNFATAQITRLLGILLQGRVPLLEALQLTRDSTSNHHYIKLLADAGDSITRGETLASAFAQTDLVNPSVCEAMRSGDKSGQLGPLLSTIADFLDEENEVTLRSLTSILEPLILVVLGVLVGFVALSLFMPLFDLTAATRGGG
jgi:type II secretory pathway component PulF